MKVGVSKSVVNGWEKKVVVEEDGQTERGNQKKKECLILNCSTTERSKEGVLE